MCRGGKKLWHQEGKIEFNFPTWTSPSMAEKMETETGTRGLSGASEAKERLRT